MIAVRKFGCHYVNFEGDHNIYVERIFPMLKNTNPPQGLEIKDDLDDVVVCESFMPDMTAIG